LVGQGLRRLPAPAAEPLGLVPGDDLDSPTGDRPNLLIDLSPQAAQADEPGRPARLVVPPFVDGDAWSPV
jgi:hypothetical protein